MTRRTSGAIWLGVGLILAALIHLPHPYREDVVRLLMGDPTVVQSKHALPVKYVPIPPLLIGMIYLWQGYKEKRGLRNP